MANLIPTSQAGAFKLINTTLDLNT